MTFYKALIEKYQELVVLVRKEDCTKDQYDQKNVEISIFLANGISAFAPEVKKIFLLNHEFFTLLLLYPAVWLKILLTLNMWVTLDDKIISPTIQQLFTSVNMEQNEELQTKSFVYNKFGTPQEAEYAAKNWYNTLILDSYKNDDTMDVIKNLVERMKSNADDILGNQVGTKALAACQASSRGTSLFHYIRLLGCLSNLVPADKCEDIKRALNDLIVAVRDPQPMVLPD